jgi:hypothetical protein
MSSIDREERRGCYNNTFAWARDTQKRCAVASCMHACIRCAMKWHEFSSDVDFTTRELEQKKVFSAGRFCFAMEFTVNVVERCRGSLWPNRLPSCASQPPHCHTCFSLSSVVAAASTRRMSAGGGHEVSGGGCELVGVSVHVSQIAFQNSTSPPHTPHTWELCPLTSLHSLDHAATPCTR